MIAPLGLSPPVITEFVEHLVRKGEPPEEVLVIRTADPQVDVGFRVLVAAIRLRYPSIGVMDGVVRVDDVDSQEGMREFLAETASVLSAAQGRWPLRLLVSGGRKSMTVALTALAPFLLAEGVYHVVVPHIRVASSRLEAVREIMREVAGSPDPVAAYEEKMEELDPVFWPPPSEYRVVRLPVIPYPPDVAQAVARVLSEGGWRREVGGGLAVALDAAGLVSILERGRIVPTELGEAVGRAIRRMLSL